MTERGTVTSDVDRLSGLLSATGPTTEVRSPLSGKIIASVPTSTPDDVARAAATARRAQPGWAATCIAERSELLLDFHDRLLDRRDDFVDLLQIESGKARLSATEEVLHVALTARYYGRTARRYLHSERGDGVLPLLTRI